METFTEVFAWGFNQKGQLGLSKPSVPSPLRFSFGVRILQVVCGNTHSAFLAHTGLVYTMGENSYGQLGIGSFASHSSPCLVEGLLKISQVACGQAHTVALACDGKVWAWGDGQFGALGTGLYVEKNSKPQLMKMHKQVLRVNCGGRHTACLDHNGGVYLCGLNTNGQLGNGTYRNEGVPVPAMINSVKDVKCGETHSLFLTRSGEVYGTGDNTGGQLGTGNQRGSSIPVKVQFLEGFFVKEIGCGGHSGCILDTGEAYVWGNSSYGQFLLPYKLNTGKTERISIGKDFGLALGANGALYAWGGNANGELGQGNFNNVYSVVQVPKLKGNSIKDIQCGANFAIGLGGNIAPKDEKKVRFTIETENHECEYKKQNKSLEEEVRKLKKKMKTMENLMELKNKQISYLKNKIDEIDYVKPPTPVQENSYANDEYVNKSISEYSFKANKEILSTPKKTQTDTQHHSSNQNYLKSPNCSSFTTPKNPTQFISPLRFDSSFNQDPDRKYIQISNREFRETPKSEILKEIDNYKTGEDYSRTPIEKLDGLDQTDDKIEFIDDTNYMPKLDSTNSLRHEPIIRNHYARYLTPNSNKQTPYGFNKALTPNLDRENIPKIDIGINSTFDREAMPKLDLELMNNTEQSILKSESCLISRTDASKIAKDYRKKTLNILNTSKAVNSARSRVNEFTYESPFKADRLWRNNVPSKDEIRAKIDELMHRHQQNKNLISNC